MIKDIAYPESLKGADLDAYLARGWYRIGQAIFTTDYIPAFELNPEEFNIPIDNGENDTETNFDLHAFDYRVQWLRFRLTDYVFGKAQQKLTRLNERFSVEISPFKSEEEIESLYAVYRSSVNFDISPTLRENLQGPLFFLDNGNVYDTWMIRLQLENRLVAVGIFDKGTDSCAGIINFFHPEFSKFSLGKYLMLLKIRYAMENNMNYYYPGYISPDYAKFDYKLFPGKDFAELYDSATGVWFPLPGA